MTDQGTQARGAVVTIAIDGTAGVGKTTLAVQWAHQMARNLERVASDREHTA